MLWRDVAILVKVETVLDADGYDLETEIARREVFVDAQSVKRSEFYAAQKSDMAVDITFLVRAADYDGETKIEYTHQGADGAAVYRVVRVWTKAGEILELNCSLESLPGSVMRKGAQYGNR